MRAAWCLLAAAVSLTAAVKLPDFERRVLPNGAVLLLMPKADVPMISLRAVVRGGAEADAAELAGLSAVTAELLRRGTPSRTADQFSEQLDSLGAGFYTSANEQSVSVSTEFLSKDFDSALTLFADALLRPSFPEEEVKKVLAQRRDSAKSAKDSPRAAISLYFSSFFYPPGHPYSKPVSGDEISLARITRSDVAGYHKRLFVGRNLTVIAAGDLDVKATAEKLAKTFGAVPAGEAYAWAAKPPAIEAKAPRLLLIDKPDATQTNFIIAQPGIHRTHPDRIPLWLVNTLFGGRFTSMLNEELRVNSGLTYGAGSQVEQNRLTGAIAINTFTATATTEKAIDLTLEVLKRLREKGFTAEQLQSAKAYIQGTFPTDRLETADQLAAVLADMELNDLDRREVDNLFAGLNAVTLEQANAVARRYYRMENLQFLLLGQAAKIRETVRKYAPTFAELSISEPGFRSNRAKGVN